MRAKRPAFEVLWGISGVSRDKPSVSSTRGSSSSSALTVRSGVVFKVKDYPANQRAQPWKSPETGLGATHDSCVALQLVHTEQPGSELFIRMHLFLNAIGLRLTSWT